MRLTARGEAVQAYSTAALMGAGLALILFGFPLLGGGALVAGTVVAVLG